MATLTINTGTIADNITKLAGYLKKQHMNLSVITKILGGYRPVLERLIEHDAMKHVHSLGDSRISNLRLIKDIKPELKTMYIKPPVVKYADQVVDVADISLNTTFRTIKALDEAAARAGKVHQVIVMIEMGELREGIVRENIFSFYEKIYHLENIEVIGLGTNLGCMYGVEPTYDKLIQLCLYRQLLEERFGKKLELVSGGSSITLPLSLKKKIPDGVNHMRVGETVFMGVSLADESQFRNLSMDAFSFSAEIIEMEKKEYVPDGVISEANIGHTAGYDEEKDHSRESYRGIMDFGEIDVQIDALAPSDKDIEFIGSSSDMTVYDLGSNKKGYKVGDKIPFDAHYMAISRLMHSKYVTKIVL